MYFDDIVDSAERIWDLLDNYKEVVEGLESTNESVISHRHNDVLRVLTVFSDRAVLPLTLIASVFGMNVIYPGEGTSEGFWAIVGLMLASIAGLAAFFRWKRWLRLRRSTKPFRASFVPESCTPSSRCSNSAASLRKTTPARSTYCFVPRQFGINHLGVKPRRAPPRPSPRLRTVAPAVSPCRARAIPCADRARGRRRAHPTGRRRA